MLYFNENLELEQKVRPISLLQITDCHLGSSPNETLLGLNTDQSLKDVLDLLEKNERPDIIVASGDISNDSGPASYQRFVDIVHDYFPDTPLAWLPGNHDDPMSMDRVDRLPIEAHHMIGGWNLIFLDSRIPMEEGGNLPEGELERLRYELNRNIDAPTIVFLHHQPVPVGSEWIDQYVVKNARDFFRVLDRFDNVRCVSWGHVHQDFETERNNVTLVATPSTCVQFKPKQQQFTVHDIMPGYRLFDLYPDGSFKTKVERVPTKDYNIDFSSLGY